MEELPNNESQIIDCSNDTLPQSETDKETGEKIFMTIYDIVRTEVINQIGDMCKQYYGDPQF